MTKDPGTTRDASNGFGSSGNVTFALFVADNRSANPGRFSSPVARVGTLPVSLRSILGAQKMHPARIVVVVDPATKQSVQPNLVGTGRLAESVEWIEVDADAPFEQRLRLVASQTDSERLVLVDGRKHVIPPVLDSQGDGME